jgi:hypothetical protein
MKPTAVNAEETAGVYADLQDLIKLQYQVGGFSFLPRQPIHSLLTGRHASKLRGRGLNFEELRNYLPGDALERTITMTAEDSVGMMLPVLAFEPMEGLGVYPNAPMVTDDAYSRVRQGVRGPGAPALQRVCTQGLGGQWSLSAAEQGKKETGPGISGTLAFPRAGVAYEPR